MICSVEVLVWAYVGIVAAGVCVAVLAAWVVARVRREGRDA